MGRWGWKYCVTILFGWRYFLTILSVQNTYCLCRMTCFLDHSPWNTDQPEFRHPLYRLFRIGAARRSANLSATSKMVLAGKKVWSISQAQTVRKYDWQIVFLPKKLISTLRPGEIKMLYILTLRPWESSHLIVSKLDSLQVKVILNQIFCHTWYHPFSNQSACL